MLARSIRSMKACGRLNRGLSALQGGSSWQPVVCHGPQLWTGAQPARGFAKKKKFRSASAHGGSKDDRAKALAAALKQVDAQFGKGAIMSLGSRHEVDVDVISTGSLTLDHALGVGGLPRGRVVEIFGPEASGKTTLALHVIAEAQKLDLNCVFVDAEHALDPVYAKGLGVNLSELQLAQPNTGEEALEITDMLVRSGAVDVIVVDSVAALVPRAELEGEMGDHHIALQARLMSQALRKLSPEVARANTLLVFINQIRQKVGVMFGSPEVTAGGQALKYYASVRIDIRKSTQIKDGDQVTGNLTKVKVVKNKVSPPFRNAEFDMIYGKGIQRMGELVDLGLKFGILKRSGAWYSDTDSGEMLGQGREKTKAYFEEHEEEADALAVKVKKQLDRKAADGSWEEALEEEAAAAAAAISGSMPFVAASMVAGHEEQEEAESSDEEE